MPITLTPLNSEAASSIFTAKRAAIGQEVIQPYVDALRQVPTGQAFEVGIEGDLTEKTAKRRLTLAAKQVPGIKLRWKVVNGRTYVQKVAGEVEASQEEPATNGKH